jgi:Fe-S-cluster containining protein
MDGDGTASERRGPRDEAFGYECRRCLNCCHFKHIQLNPYEVARLARNRGLSTTEVRRAFTFEGTGVALAQTPDGACVFLGTEGCTVHPDRPLVCRLYPLGRHLSWDGSERFSHLAPHPKSAGLLSKRGTIGEYLEEQGAEPFIEAADEYMAWLNRALEDTPEAADHLDKKILAPVPEDDLDLMDMDVAIAAHQAATDATPPVDIEARKRLHLSILYDQLSSKEEETS